jgi:hypothetical protein
MDQIYHPFHIFSWKEKTLQDSTLEAREGQH